MPTTIPIQVFHNVARECRYCGVPVTDEARALDVDGDQALVCPENKRGSSHVICLANFDGYKPGQPIVRVFRADFETDHTDPQRIGDELYEAFNIGDEFPSHRHHAMAVAYRARKLRSLSTGDVVVIGEAPLAVADIGFMPIANPNILTDWPEDSVTVILRDDAAA